MGMYIGFCTRAKGAVENKIGFMSLGMGQMYVREKLQVIIFFRKGNSFGLGACGQTTDSLGRIKKDGHT
jgi:hypothetical protein